MIFTQLSTPYGIYKFVLSYGSSSLQDIEGYELGDQPSVEAFLKGVHTFRAGVEARLTPEFSFRAGYNYASSNERFLCV